MYLSAGSSAAALGASLSLLSEILMAVTQQSRWQSERAGRYECTHYSVVRDNRNVNLGRQLSVLGSTLRCLSPRRWASLALKTIRARLLVRSLERMIKRGSIHRLSALRPEGKSFRLYTFLGISLSTRCSKSTDLNFRFFDQVMWNFNRRRDT